MVDISNNKRAYYDYEILEKFEAGIVLVGGEVKALRNGRANLSEAYAGFDNSSELWIYNMHIPQYEFSDKSNQFPRRTRKLLLHKREIYKLVGKLKKGGYTLVPISMYFNKKGYVKISLGLGRGKKDADKRQAIKEREWKRSKARILKGEVC